MGSILAILASCLASAKDLTSKQLASRISPNLSTFGSFCFALPFYLILLFILWGLGLESFSIGTAFLSYVAIRALTDTVAESFKMHALARGEISEVSALISLYPIFLLFLSPLITGDPLSSNILLGVVASVVGTVILVYKPTAKIHWKAVIFGTISSIFFALNGCFDRLSVQSASPALSGFCMTLFSCVLLTPLLSREVNIIPSLRSGLFPLFQRGFFEVGFMVLKLWALTHLSAPEVSAILRATLILNVLGGNAFFAELNLYRKLFGAAISTAGIVWIIFGS